MLLETLARDAQCRQWVDKGSQTDGRGSGISSSLYHFPGVGGWGGDTGAWGQEVLAGEDTSSLNKVEKKHYGVPRKAP